jgi:hypothetical protein
MEITLIRNGVSKTHNIDEKSLPKELAVVKQVLYDVNSNTLTISSLDGKKKVIPLSIDYKSNFAALSTERAQLESLKNKVAQFVSPSRLTGMSASDRVMREFEEAQQILDELSIAVQKLKIEGRPAKDRELVAARKKRDEFLENTFLPLLDKKNEIFLREKEGFKAREKEGLARIKKEPSLSERDVEAKALARKIQYVKTLPEIPPDLLRGIEKYDEWNQQIEELARKIDGSPEKKQKELKAEIKYLQGEQQTYLLSYLAPMLREIRMRE